MNNFNDYGICKKCHHVIVMRKPGSSVWKLTGMKARQDKEQHEPILTLSSFFGAMKIKKLANDIFWKMPEKKRTKYNKAREESVNQAAKELGYEKI